MARPDDRRWLALALAGTAVVLTLSTWFSTTAVTPDLTADWGLSTNQVGWLTNAVQIGFVVGALISSVLALADNFRMQNLMAVAAILTAVANAALLLEPGIEGAIIARFFTGAGLACVYPPAMKFIATWFQHGRGLALGAMVGSLTLGSAAPHLLRGMGASVSWEWVIVATSISCVIAAGIMKLALNDGPFQFSSARVDPRQFAQIFRNRAAMLANFGYFGHMWELYAMWGWILAYAAAAIENGTNILAGNASLLAFAVIAAGTPGCILGGVLADRIGRCLTTIIMLICSGTCAVLIGFFFDGPAWLFALVAIIWGATSVADSAQFSAAVTELADRQLVGTMLAFQMGVGFAITVFTIWLTPIFADWLGNLQWSFLLLVPGPIFAVLAMVILRTLPESAAMAGGRR